MPEALPERAPLSPDPAASVAFFDSLTHITADGTWLGTTRHDARCGRLLAELDRCGPARACLVAIASVIENETVLAAARRHSERFVPVGSLNPSTFHSEGEIANAVAELASAGFAGLKLHPRL